MILRGDALRFPLDPAETFGRTAPLILEVGFGSGHFLTEIALALPDHDFLGVEKAMASVTRSYTRLTRKHAGNVRLIHGYAEFTLRELITPRGVRRVYVNFPDPWPRIGHRRRRLIQQPLLRLLASRLADDGEMIFTSDHEEYFEYTLRQGERCEYFEVDVREPSTEYLSTKYARRWLQQDKLIQQAVFTKRESPEEAFEPRTEICSMYHALLEGELPSADSFESTTTTHDDGRLILNEVLRSADDTRLLFQLLAVEADLRQDLLVQARPSSSGHLVELTHFGSPAVTRLVRDSVGIVASWLEARGMKIVQRAY